MPNQQGKHTQHWTHWAFMPHCGDQNLASHSYVIGQLKVVEFTSQEQLLRMACNLEHVF